MLVQDMKTRPRNEKLSSCSSLFCSVVIHLFPRSLHLLGGFCSRPVLDPHLNVFLFSFLFLFSTVFCRRDFSHFLSFSRVSFSECSKSTYPEQVFLVAHVT